MNNHKHPIRFLLMATALSSTFSAHAVAGDDDWNYRFILYGQAAGLDGDVTVRGLTSSVDLSFSDLLEDLEFATQALFYAQRGPWSVAFDFSYLGLGESFDRPPATVDADTYIAELTGGYRVAEPLELLAGVRYVRLENKIDFDGPLGIEVDDKQDWVDPLIGARLTLPLAERWTFRGRADIGGFGVGSDLAWQLGAYFEYAPSPSWSTVVGYRILDIDYEDGEGFNEFGFDAQLSGPVLGVSFNF